MDQPFTICSEVKMPSRVPMNSLLFSEDAKYLITGGDDEVVRVWSTDTFECQQTLSNDNWGQVTSLIWIYNTLPSKEIVTSLSVGSARGYDTFYSLDDRGTKPFSKAPATFKIFNFNDSVEQQAFDRLNHRLAFASHSGQFKIYTYNRVRGSAGSLQQLWSTSLGVAIPRGVFFFGGANQSIITLGLENSEVCCREAVRDQILWKKEFIGGIGNAALSTDEQYLLVDNLTSGNFDLYQISESDGIPMRTLPTHSKRRVVKQCVFFEGTKLAVCGSDTNKVVLADMARNRVLQTLITGKESDMTQAVAVTPASSRRVLIAATCGEFLYIWEKKSKTATRDSEDTPPHGQATPVAEQDFWSSQGPAVLLVVLLTYNNWSPYFFRLLEFLSGLLSEVKGMLQPVAEY